MLGYLFALGAGMLFAYLDETNKKKGLDSNYDGVESLYAIGKLVWVKIDFEDDSEADYAFEFPSKEKGQEFYNRIAKAGKISGSYVLKNRVNFGVKESEWRDIAFNPELKGTLKVREVSWLGHTKDDFDND